MHDSPGPNLVNPYHPQHLDVEQSVGQAALTAALLHAYLAIAASRAYVGLPPTWHVQTWPGVYERLACN